MCATCVDICMCVSVLEDMDAHMLYIHLNIRDQIWGLLQCVSPPY